MDLEKILGTDTGKEAFYKLDRNFDKIKTELEGIDVSGDAVDINYDNTESELEAENVQEAIDELKELNNYLDANKVDNSRVLTDVPVNAKFTDTVYTHPTTAGYKHIPAGGAANQYLKYSANGTAVWSYLGDAPSVNGKSIWVGEEGSKGTDANTIYFCY